MRICVLWKLQAENHYVSYEISYKMSHKIRGFIQGLLKLEEWKLSLVIKNDGAEEFWVLAHVSNDIFK